ncbi:MAG TPA: HD-GYP domain-containing protein, partial [Egibacteraceae bacterium]|nr:HD-GYP domain-containing protein [Egibacteraceae bacterium]
MSRPVLGLVLRAGAVLLPVVVSVAAALATAALLPAVTSVWATILWWAAVLLVAQTCLLATAYAARQLLPLAVLLRMSLLFPDRAPSRFRVWRSVGSADALERRVEAGADPTGARDAALMLGLVRAVGHHDPATRGHSERVRLFVDLIAEELRLAAGDHDRLRWVALLHDVGKLSVAPEVLNKPGRLDGAEWAQVHKHPAEGARLTAPLGPWLGAWAPGVRDHHERYDGSGYPAGLGGAEISFAGRIVAVADAFETMTARRPYKRPLTVAAARRELVRCAGSHFDPQVVRALLNVSIGRLRRRVGTMALLIQIPLVGRLVDRAPAGAGQTLVAALILATLAAVGIMDPASGPAGAPRGSR